MWPGWERSAKPELHISWVAFAVTFPLAFNNRHQNCRNTDHCVSLGITNGSPSAAGHTEPITAWSQTWFQIFIISGRPQNEKREWLGRGGEDRLSDVFALLPKKFQTESQESSLLHLVWIGFWHQTAQEFAPHKSKHWSAWAWTPHKEHQQKQTFTHAHSAGWWMNFTSRQARVER